MTVEKETTREDWDRLREQYPAIDPEESNVEADRLAATGYVTEAVREKLEADRLAATAFKGRFTEEEMRSFITLGKPLPNKLSLDDLSEEAQQEFLQAMGNHFFNNEPKEAREDIKGMTPPKPTNTTGMFGSPDLSLSGSPDLSLSGSPEDNTFYGLQKSQWKVEGSVDEQPIDTQEKLKTHELPKEAREDIKGMTPDMVNHPSHYTYGKIECIDGIEESMSTEAFRGYCKGAAMKYLWRYERKGKPLEDLQKAQWYLVKLISSHQ